MRLTGRWGRAGESLIDALLDQAERALAHGDTSHAVGSLVKAKALARMVGDYGQVLEVAARLRELGRDGGGRVIADASESTSREGEGEGESRAVRASEL